MKLRMKVRGWLNAARSRKRDRERSEFVSQLTEWVKSCFEKENAVPEVEPPQAAEAVPASEFISRVAACLAANAAITALGEYSDKGRPNWAVLPVGRCCSPMTVVSIEIPKWWNLTAVASYGTANGTKVTSKLTRAQLRLVREMIAEAQTAAEMLLGNRWSVIDY